MNVFSQRAQLVCAAACPSKAKNGLCPTCPSSPVYVKFPRAIFWKKKILSEPARPFCSCLEGDEGGLQHLQPLSGHLESLPGLIRWRWQYFGSAGLLLKVEHAPEVISLPRAVRQPLFCRREYAPSAPSVDGSTTPDGSGIAPAGVRGNIRLQASIRSKSKVWNCVSGSTSPERHTYTSPGCQTLERGGKRCLLGEVLAVR